MNWCLSKVVLKEKVNTFPIDASSWMRRPEENKSTPESEYVPLLCVTHWYAHGVVRIIFGIIVRCSQLHFVEDSKIGINV